MSSRSHCRLPGYDWEEVIARCGPLPPICIEFSASLWDCGNCGSERLDCGFDIQGASAFIPIVSSLGISLYNVLELERSNSVSDNVGVAQVVF